MNSAKRLLCGVLGAGMLALAGSAMAEQDQQGSGVGAYIAAQGNQALMKLQASAFDSVREHSERALGDLSWVRISEGEEVAVGGGGLVHTSAASAKAYSACALR